MKKFLQIITCLCAGIVAASAMEDEGINGIQNENQINDETIVTFDGKECAKGCDYIKFDVEASIWGRKIKKVSIDEEKLATDLKNGEKFKKITLVIPGLVEPVYNKSAKGNQQGDEPQYTLIGEEAFAGLNSDHLKINLKFEQVKHHNDFKSVGLTKDCSKMFYNSKSITKIDLSGALLNVIKNMKEMFLCCHNLKCINFGNHNMKPEDTAGMFKHCESLETLDLTKLDTTNVTNMADMFCYCKKLKNLNISSFNTTNVTNMGYMFSNCQELTNLNVTNFDTKNVENMSFMFAACGSLKELDVGNFDTKKVKNMSGMFYNCNCLQKLNLSNFNTCNVESMRSMFEQCQYLEDLTLGTLFNTSNVKRMSLMFSNCSVLKVLDLSNFDTRNVKDAKSMKKMFANCICLEKLTLGDNFHIKPGTDIDGVIANCNHYEDLKKLLTSKISQ